MAAKTIRKNYFKNSAVKKTALRRRRWVRLIKTAGFLLGLTGMSLAFVLCHDFLTQYDYFNARKIVVTGQAKLNPAEILQQAHIQKGSNILSTNLSKTRKKLLAHPWIEEVDISRKLPDEIHIQIREQQALAVLDLGRKFIINTSGIVFKEWTESDPGNLPIVSGLQFSDINVSGTRHTPAFQAVMTVLDMGGRQGSILPNTTIQHIRVDREIGVSLLAYGESKEIRLGFNHYTDKYKNLDNILFHLKTRPEFADFETIDLNDLNRVVVHPVKASPAGVQKEV